MFSPNGGRSAAEAMGSKASHLAHAKKLRDRAEECRVISRLVKDEKLFRSTLAWLTPTNEWY